jgi:transcription-repair coupling factor (superfamily II helicase)
MVRLKFSGNDAVLLPPAELALIWPYAADAGKLKLDKADGSTWWERRGEAEQEIQVAAEELAKHRAQQHRRQAAKLSRYGLRWIAVTALVAAEARLCPQMRD